MKDNVVSIIMPVYNAGQYVAQAIESVLAQTYTNWELLIINDGSVDDSLDQVEKIKDHRIQVFSQKNEGASAARNVGLNIMAGSYFCFLDADDVMPSDSLAARIAKFKENPKLDFVDGCVWVMDKQLRALKRVWTPSFGGNPFNDLISLGERSFFGLTWMIKRKAGRKYQMEESLSHSEDLLFFMELSRGNALYDHTDQVVLKYRNSEDSAMKNLRGLENGYRFVYETVKEWQEAEASMLGLYKSRTKRIMIRSYLRKGMLLDAGRIISGWV